MKKPGLPEVQWVKWRTRFGSKSGPTLWHARIGFKRGPKATLCGCGISPVDSIAMETIGSYRREFPPLDKKRVCQRCLKAVERIRRGG